MTETKTFLRGKKHLLSQVLVIGAGVLLFLIIFFADKTNLTNEGGIGLKSNPASAQTPIGVDDSVLLKLHPRMPVWSKELKSRKSAEKLPILDSIIVTLQTEKRFASASDFALQRIAIDSSLSNLWAVASLSQQALQMEWVRTDSVVLKKYLQRSISFASEVLKQEPGNEEALMTLGLGLVASGGRNSMQGILTIRRVLEINPDNIDASFQLGMFSLQTGQFDKARERFEHVLRLDPMRDDARLQLAFSLIQTGSPEEANRLLDEIISRGESAGEWGAMAEELKKSIK